jgi:hypothetical protein
MRILSTREKLLVRMIGKSDFREPYTIQVINPSINIVSMPYEIAFAFFSRIIFNSWGSNDIAVHIPANTPMYSSKFFIFCYEE